ncbi:MAG: DUF4249 domain-containing protein [Cytophagales bacterium]|nr:DUF4249 domain-containing protein [Cytophagales bacterium]MDW8383953.1 DUF4249 family protein [Flammeovirgaceae bacterium]
MQKRFNYKANKFLTIFAGITLLLGSCEEVVRPPIGAGNPSTVIEAWLTDSADRRLNFVKITQTIAYDAPIAIPLVSGGSVRIISENDTMPFVETSPGYYQAVDSFFRAVAYRTYRLEVRIQEQTYTATATAPPPIKIDSIVFTWREAFLNQPAGVYAQIFLRDARPNATHGWRRFSLINLQKRSNIIVIEQKEWDGKDKYTYLFPEAFFINDFITINVYGLSAHNFQYLQNIQQLSEKGTPAQSVPENPISNFEPNTLGFFSVASVTSISDTIRFSKLRAN